MAKQYDPDIEGWATVMTAKGYRRVPIRKRDAERRRAKEWNYANIRRKITELSSSDYEDGTYNAKTLKEVDYPDGFQVTYCQLGDTYTDEEHDELIAMFLKLATDGIVSLGKFEGTPEISFHFHNKEDARKYAKRFNQKSIWDWENCKEIKTGGTGKVKEKRRRF